MFVEAAIDAAADAERALLEGAGRLEVCNALDAGGLTPSRALLEGCLEFGATCMAMARPRAGGHVYGAADFVRLEADVDALVARGVDGIVFGVLTADGRVDAVQVRAIVERCAGLETVFHRAFDETQNAAEALDTLIEWGVTRVLTSGGAPTAIEGAGTIAMLVTRARGRIQVLPGGGVRAANVADLATATGVKQVHARASEPGVIAGIRAALG